MSDEKHGIRIETSSDSVPVSVVGRLSSSGDSPIVHAEICPNACTSCCFDEPN